MHSGAAGILHCLPGIFVTDNYRLTAAAIIATSECIAWAVAAARRAVSAAILAAETAFRTARLALPNALSGTMTAAMPAKSLAATNPRSMTMGTVAVCLTVPLTVAFLAPGVAMAAVWCAVVKSTTAIIAVPGKTASTAATESPTATAARAVVAARTIR